jgi:hypothetical protein
MDPLTLGVLFGGNMLMGGLKAEQQAKQRRSEAQMRAAEIEASPWTGKEATTQVSTPQASVWADMAGGAMNATTQLQGLKGKGLFDSADVSKTAGAAGGGMEDAAAAEMGLGPKNPYVTSPWTLYGRK